MADQENENRPAATPAGEDTRTRKTVRLRPQAPASSPTQLADPLAGHSAAPADFHVLEDTQTRKTIKLKPIRPGEKEISAPAPAADTPKMPTPKAAAPAAAKPLSSGEDTSTRKATILRPSAPAAPSADGEDTSTRKATVLRRPVSPAAAPAAAPADDDAENLNSRTVRIQRPARPTVPLSAAAPKMVPPPAPTLKKPVAAASPAAAPLPKPAVAPAAEAAKTVPPVADIPLQQPLPDGAPDSAAAASPSPAKWFIALAAVCGILIFATALVTTLHYLEFEHQLNYTHLVPGLPQAK